MAEPKIEKWEPKIVAFCAIGVVMPGPTWLVLVGFNIQTTFGLYG
jgi:hypothetical protein